MSVDTVSRQARDKLLALSTDDGGVPVRHGVRSVIYHVSRCGGSGGRVTVESALVGIIVAVCAVFSAWRLMSIRLRLKTLDALSGLPGVAGLRRKTLAKMSGGCGACQSA